MKHTTARGFTIVELLIVIVVIAILAAIVLTAYTNVQAKARQSRAQNDISILQKAIVIARQTQSKTLQQITGTGYSGGPCDTLEPAALAKTHACWVRYQQTIDAIAAASGVSLAGLRDGNQYGHPYFIDENEGELPASPCTKDQIVDRGEKYSVGQGDEITRNVPAYLPGCP